MAVSFLFLHKENYNFFYDFYSANKTICLSLSLTYKLLFLFFRLLPSSLYIVISLHVQFQAMRETVNNIFPDSDTWHRGREEEEADINKSPNLLPIILPTIPPTHNWPRR